MKISFVFILILLPLSIWSKSIEVMTYNVENLFDTIKDQGKNDWTFLPLKTKGKKAECEKVTSKYYRKQCLTTDWTEERLKMKLGQIKKALLSERKNLPDILALQEIENANVVGMLAKELGFPKFEVSESPDKRGVDVAILYRPSKNLKMLSRKEHQLGGDYLSKKPTRNILEVEFLVGGKFPLVVFANHWPSLGNPNQARVAAATALRARMKELIKENPNRHLLTMGDFNTIARGKPHPFTDILMKDDFMNDVHDEALKVKEIKEKGTYYYKRGKVWNRLDRIFVDNSLKDKKGLDIEAKSYQIYAPEFLREEFKSKKVKEKVPLRYNFEAVSAKNAGYSDHFPVLVKLTF